MQFKEKILMLQKFVWFMT